MNSVGRAYGILSGRMNGDRKKAKEFLESMSPQQRRVRNRTETRARGRAFKKKYKMGAR